MAAKTRVLYVSPLPPPHGGIATLTTTLLENGLGEGFELACVNTSVVDRPLHGQWVLGFAEAFRNLRILRDLLRRLVSWQPDVVHVNSSLSRSGVLRDALCAFIARAAGKKVVTHYHGCAVRFVAKGGLPARLLRRLARLSHVNIASSSSSRDALIGVGANAESTIHLPNFVDAARFDAGDDALAAKKDSPALRALYVGGLTKAKGAFDAVAVAARSPNLHLTMVAGSMAEEFREIERALPANVSVRLALSHAELVRAYLEHDLFLFMSHHEGFPLSVTEAMALGLPALATRVGAVPDMIEEGKGGWLVEPGAVEAAAAIAARIADRASLKELGLFNRDKARRDYRFPAVAARLAGVYAGLLSTRA